MSKKIITLIIAMFSAIGVHSQSRIAGYVYWFNNDYGAVQTVSVSPAEALSLDLQLPVTVLGEGFHTLNLRSFEENGMWSGILTKQFYKAAIAAGGGVNAIMQYQYWLDNNFAEAITTPAVENQIFVLNEMLNLATLGEGFHTLNFRAADAAGKWSGILTKQFYKAATAAGGGGANTITQYQYWLDKNFAEAITTQAAENQIFVLNEMLNLATLGEGFHTLNFRAADAGGKWSGILTKQFYKMPTIAGGGELSKIVAYTYWIDDDYENRTDVKIETPVTEFVLLDNLDLNHVHLGNHLINFRFQDNAGRWSVVHHANIEKECNQTYDLEENLTACQGNYTFPDGKVWYVDRDTTHINYLLTTAGCDSIVTVNLTVFSTYEIGRTTNIDYFVNEDFESYDEGTLASTLPSWNLTATGTGGSNQKVVSSGENKYLQMAGTAAGAELQHALPVSMSEIFSYEVKFSTSSSSTHMPVRLYANSLLVVGIDYVSGKLRANNGVGSSDYISDNDFPVGEWYNIRIESDITNMTYSVFVDNVLQQFTKGTDTKTVFNLANMPTKIALVATYATIYFDDVKVYHSSIEYDRVPVSVCAGELPYQFGTQSLSEPGEYEEIFQSVTGCDSTVFIQFDVLPAPVHEFSASSCVSYTWNAETYTASGDYIQTFTAANACDSIVTLHLTIFPLPEVPTYAKVTNIGEYVLPAVGNGVWTKANGDVVTVAETSGVYTLTITGAGGCKNSTMLTVTIETKTGIEDILSEKLTIYPNPAKDELIIEHGELKIEKVEIYDLSGKIIVNCQLSTVNSINLSALPQGAYVLMIYTDSGVTDKKVVKE